MHVRPVSMIRTHDDRVGPATGMYEIDDRRTSVQFVAQHLMVTKVRGRFTKLRGQINIAENPEDSDVAVSISAASLDTGNSRRDTHLRSADFFDVDRFPNISFRSRSLRAMPDAAWELVGDLTIRDISHPVALNVTFDGGDAPAQGDDRISFGRLSLRGRERFWCGKLSMCPKLIVPLQIDLAMTLDGTCSVLPTNIRRVVRGQRAPVSLGVVCRHTGRRFVAAAPSVGCLTDGAIRGADCDGRGD